MKGLLHKRRTRGFLFALFFAFILFIPNEVEAAQLTVTANKTKEYTASAGGETINLTLSGANANTRLMGKPSWISCSGSGSNYKLITSKNASTSSRKDDVVFFDGAKTFTVRITQKGTSKAAVIMFNVNGGSGRISNKSGTVGNTIGTLPNVPTAPKGMSFAGWYTEAKSGIRVTSNTKITVPILMLYAHYTYNTYKITFNSQGGNKVDYKMVTYSKKYGTMETPTREGYEFLGWYTAANGGKLITPSTKVTVAAHQTLYAQWRKKQTFQIIFLYGNGERRKVIEVYEGDIIVLPDPGIVVDPPYEWKWNVVQGRDLRDGEGQHYEPGQKICVSGDYVIVGILFPSSYEPLMNSIRDTFEQKYKLELKK
ncbi:MAG: InlB B-repeat-containing protein [Lachnospiraceae bacterium]|nr:InlB B-repeat-containing protein [Lachnospiraceae bacterium]